jgi:hypothetical protein
VVATVTAATVAMATAAMVPVATAGAAVAAMVATKSATGSKNAPAKRQHLPAALARSIPARNDCYR